MVRYKLLARDGRQLQIFIDEKVKEDFKEMMGWTEEFFQEHTIMVKEVVKND